MSDDKQKPGGDDPLGKPQPPRLQIRVGDEMARGAFANMVVVHNNDSEFVMDFVFVEPQRPQGQVVSRVVTHPKTAKRFLLGLTRLVKAYEERHGEIADPERGAPPQGSYH